MPVVAPAKRSPGRHVPYYAPSTQVKIIEPVSERVRPVVAALTTTTTTTPSWPVPQAPYPSDLFSRARFCTDEGKRLTAHQWKLYDCLLRIPVGRVTTYGSLARALSSSPQAIGQALKNNPFAPDVPCHRVIASTLFIGGFMGTESTDEQSKVGTKLALLKAEGVDFDDKGFLLDRAKLWQP